MTIHAHDSSRALAAARAHHEAKTWTDTYRFDKRHAAFCPRCHSTHLHGRWGWKAPTADLRPAVCPACRRIEHGIAAHVVELAGAVHRHWNEVRGLIGNVERAEVAEHPMERVMRIDVHDDRVQVATTGLHVARRIVAALVRRFRHGVKVQFRDCVTRVEWQAEAID